MAKRKPAPKWCFWRGNVLWCRFTVDGKEVRESLRTGSIEVARKRAEDARARLIGAARFGEVIHTWEDAVSGWSARILETVSARTALRYEQSLRGLSSHLTGLAVADIAASHINKLVLARQQAKRTSATIRRDLTAVASVLDFAIDENWREGNPARERARRIKESRDPITLPSATDIEAVMAPMTGGIESIARFAWATGMRLNEITTLRRRNIRGNLCNVVKGKGNKQRTIELNADAMAVISRQPISMTSDYIFHHDGERYSCVSTNWRRAVQTAQKTAQKEKRDFVVHRFHDLRHVFAVETLQSGRMGLYELAKHLGHSSVMTTENHYLEFLTPDQAKAARDGTLHGTGAAVSAVTDRPEAIEDKKEIAVPKK